MLNEKIFNTGTVEINYAEGPPSGPPLVLLHGLPGRWQEFSAVISILSQRFHIYALDGRGQGKSGRIPGEYRAKFYIDDVVDFLEKEVDEPTTLFGMSAGGFAALGAAGRVPELLRAVIVGDSPIDFKLLISWMSSEEFLHFFSTLRYLAGEELSIEELERQIADIPVRIPGENVQMRYGDRPDISANHIQQLAATLSDLDPGVLEYHAEGRAKEFFEGFDLDMILEGIRCPVLVLQGNPSLGGMMTDEALEHLRSIVPNVQHDFFEDVGHDLGLESGETALLQDSINNFLESL